MSTPAERKFVAFLRKMQTGDLDGNPLSYVNKIYSDRPRQDVSSSSFPRIQVKELGGVSHWTGIGATDRIYELTLETIIYVSMDEPFSEATVSAFWDQSRNLSPEEACGAIAYHIAGEVGENKGTLHSDNSYQFLLKGNASYSDMGVDNEYFDKINVYKGSMAFNFLLRT